MDPSAYAFVQGIRGTRETLERWNRRPWPVIRGWLLGSVLAAVALLAAVWMVATLARGPATVALFRPPLVVGDMHDVVRILAHNALVLALHAMACVAGFIAGSSLPLQAREQTGLMRVVHERGGRLAILFVIGATTFSLSAQAYVLGLSVAHVAFALDTTPAVVIAVPVLLLTALWEVYITPHILQGLIGYV